MPLSPNGDRTRSEHDQMLNKKKQNTDVIMSYAHLCNKSSVFDLSPNPPYATFFESEKC